MRKRTRARECALQILYQVDIGGIDCKDECLGTYWKWYQEDAEAAVKEFAEELVDGVLANLKEIDRVVGAYAENWKMDRMAIVDRNILRIATFELMHKDDIPPKVSINEAIDIAKKFGDPESGKFVNGILDKISKAERCDAKKS
ncbi:MAG: transcription antitermination factor NusB [Candidatus Omnitrophota bacterium]